MKKIIFILLPLLTSTLFTACSINGEEIKININKDIKTAVKDEGNSSSKTETTSNFRRDNHMFDSRYSDFDYPTLGYQNQQGLYYGYYDQNGYFYNNMYFEYDDKYRYEDRKNRCGAFDRDKRHIRLYQYHNNNNWNRERHYREPMQFVGDYYYYEHNPNPRFRVQHPQHIEELSIGAGSYNNMSYRNHSDNIK